MLRRSAISLSCVAACASASSPAHPPPKPALEVRIDAALRPYVETDNFSGVILVRTGGRVVYERGFGLANRELGVANTPATRFHVASVTKAFTAAAVLVLAERGRLRTSDPLATYVPDFPGGDRISIDHLLRHTSGIPDTASLPTWEVEERLPHTPADLTRLVRDLPRAFAPGARYQYSNANYAILAFVLERVTKQTYPALLTELVLAPLGLAATVHDGDASVLIPNRASGGEPDGVRGTRFPRYIDWSSRTGSGSLVTTARDLDAFIEGILTRRLLSATSIATILAPAEGFAYGWNRDERYGRKQLRAGGRSPGFNASIERYLDDGTTVIVLSNSYSPVVQDAHFLAALHGAVFDKPVPPPSDIEPLPVARGALAEFAGTYRFPHEYVVPDAVLELSDRGDYLAGSFNKQAPNAIYLVGKDRFRDRSFWVTVRFTRGANGRVDGMHYDLFDGYVAKRVE